VYPKEAQNAKERRTMPSSGQAAESYDILSSSCLVNLPKVFKVEVGQVHVL